MTEFWLMMIFAVIFYSALMFDNRLTKIAEILLKELR